MAFPQHLLLAFGGPLGVSESWSCSLRMTSTGAASVPGSLLDTYAGNNVEAVDAKVYDFIVAAGGYWNTDAKHGFTKLNAIDEAGHYIGDETHQVIHSPARASTASSSNGPYQIATAITLRTDKSRGLAAHGRFFAPTAVPVVSNEGYCTPIFAQRWGAATKAFVETLNNWPGADLPDAPNVCVVSRGKRLGNNTYGAGAWSKVTTIAVGNVLDTQRSRRRNLNETYLEYPISGV